MQRVILRRKILLFIKIVTFASAILIPSSHCVELPDETGGYSIVLALDENIPEPENGAVDQFIQNVQTSVETFSSKLWEASRGHFYIKSLDILVPSKWTVENSAESTTQNYKSAHLRITSTAERPYASNPSHICGKIGQYIELPLTFFDSPNAAGPYGPQWKALLNLWATYRWGVQDEHGYIGDVKFPYTYRDHARNNWQVTGCSDQPILGRYQDMLNPSLQCSGVDTLNASSTCRFVPSATGQSASTSLMHFHWVESVVGFCDESNHNKLAPNRQNFFCDHKSVWEVIRESPEYQVVTSPINDTLPTPIFNVVRHNPKPALYILLDRGLIQGPLAVANQIPRAIINFLGDIRRNSTVAALSSFPGNGENVISKDIDWSPIGPNLDIFADVVGSLRTRGPLQRDFSQAVMSVVDEVKAKGHPNGVVLLVVKYGADLNNFGSYLSEFEVVHALNEQGIVLCSIELSISDPPGPGYAHLSELAKQTGGLYTVLRSYGEAQTALRNVFNYLHKLLDADEIFPELKSTYRTLLRTNGATGRDTKFAVPKSGESPISQGKVQAHFSTHDGSLTRANFNVEGTNATSGIISPVIGVTFRKTQDWLEEGSKWTYSFSMSSGIMVPYSDITIKTCNMCTGSMLVRTDIADESVKNVSIEAFTSLEGSIADLSNGPIIIFAKILKSGAPIVNALVTAISTDVITGAVTEIYLTDSGQGTPDEQSRDGIYSGYLIPERDGNYRVSVVVKGDYSQTRSEIVSSVENLLYIRQPYGRLLPVDQGEMGCAGARCNTEVLPPEAVVTTEISASIQVSGAAAYSPEPTTINTFFIAPNPQQDTIRLTWFAPSVPGLLLSVSAYEIRQSSDKLSLILDFENQELVPTTLPGAPGYVETLTVLKPESTMYFGIRSMFKGKYSKVSSIEAFEVQDDSVTATTITDTPSTQVISTSMSSEIPSSTSSDISSSPPSTPVPTEDKPWHKKAVGIIVITLACLIVVAALIGILYYLWSKRSPDKGKIKITPPSESARHSIPQ